MRPNIDNATMMRTGAPVGAAPLRVKVSLHGSLTGLTINLLTAAYQDYWYVLLANTRDIKLILNGNWLTSCG